MQRLVAVALVGIAQVGAMNLDLAQQVMGRGENRRQVQADVKSRGLVKMLEMRRAPGST